MFDTAEIAERRAEGVFWPGEFACPVFLAEFPPLAEDPRPRAAPTFLGTSTLIGGDLFLSARHVFFEADGTPIYSEPVEGEDGWSTRPALGILRIKEQVSVAVVAIEWIEAHPDPTCDLVIGKLVEWYAVPPWEAIARPAPLNDVIATGFPYDRMSVLNTGDVSAIDTALDSPRFVKGYVTRALQVRHDPLLSPYSFEVSFSLTEGMSGCPLWYHRDNERSLYGIASGSLSQMRPVESETQIAPDGRTITTETVRVEDYGVGVRIDSVLHWEIAQLDGCPFGLVLATAGREA